LQTIFKFPLELVGWQSIDVPLPAKLLAVKAVGNDLFAWFQVETYCVPPKFYPRQREFKIFGTGEEMSFDTFTDYHHFDTIIMGEFVWHVYCKNYEEE